MRYAITDIRSKEKFEDIVAEMVRDGLNKTKLERFCFTYFFKENNQSRSFEYNQTASC